MENMNQDLESKVRAEVLQELEAKGATIISQVYEGEYKALKLIDGFDDTLVKAGAEQQRIKERYAPKVAEEKMKALNTDLLDTREKACNELDEILKKDLKYRKEAIETAQLKAEYRVNRQEALNLLIALKGTDIPVDIVGNIIGPLTEAKDVNTLKVCQLLVGSDTVQGFTVGRAIDSANAYLNNAELTALVSQAKNFIRSGATEKNMSFRVMLHNYKNK